MRSDTPLGGFVVGVTANRRAADQVAMLERCGARCVVGPVMQRSESVDDAELLDFTRKLIANPADWVILMTQSGIEQWFDLADTNELLDELLQSLSESKVLTRGKKALGAAVRYGINVNFEPGSGRLGEIVAHLSRKRTKGRKIVIQVDGRPSAVSLAQLKSLGANVVRVQPYGWDEADNVAAERLVRMTSEGLVDAVTFTSAVAVHNFMGLAESIGEPDPVIEAFNGQVLPVCIGPVCAGALEIYDVTQPLVADVARLGALVRTVAGHFSGLATPLVLNGLEVEMRGHQLTVAGAKPKVATSRERQVLAVLAERPGVVYSKRKLLRQVWCGSTSDEHVVEVTIARLRRRLGEAGEGVETVRRRGYRLRAEPA